VSSPATEDRPDPLVADAAEGHGVALPTLAGLWEPALIIGLLLVAWQFAVSVLGVPRFLVPPPLEVLGRLRQQAGLLLTHTASTLLVATLGFLAGVVVGILSALAIVQSRLVERFLLPLVVFSQVVPKIAVAPLLIIWFGFSPKSRVIVAFLICFFPILISTVTGLKSVQAELLDLTRQLRASAWQTFWMVSFPSALPHLFAGLKVAITLAVVGAIVAEWVGSDTGLGYMLLVANGNFDVTLSFSVLVILTLLGVVLFAAVELLERLALPWHVSRRIDLHQQM
jgi:NitT/TauT family transport system permease protein